MTIVYSGPGGDILTGLPSDFVSYQNATSGVAVALGGGGYQDTGGSGWDSVLGFGNLIGSAYNDILTGDGNSNLLIGGAGADIFVFAPVYSDSSAYHHDFTQWNAAGGGGADVIADFSPSQGDRINLSAFLSFHTLADVLAVATQQGSDTVITLPQGSGSQPYTLRLSNVALQSLTPRDFVFHNSSDFNGDGVSDFAVVDQLNGVWGTLSSSPAQQGLNWWVVDPSQPFFGHSFGNNWQNPQWSNYRPVGAGDINGDGIADLVVRNSVTGDWGYLPASPVGIPHLVGPSSLDYAVVGVADFNGDGRDEVAFRNNVTGDWGYMAMNPGLTAEVWHGIGPSSTAYSAIGAGDFNGDGVADLAFRNNTTGDWGYMALNNTGAGFVWHGIGPSSTAYAAVAAGDFNGDGVWDMAFRNNATGDWGYMALNSSGAGFQWTSVGPSSTAFSVASAGDFNGDGVMDLAFHNGGGDRGYMALNAAGTGQTWIPLAPDFTKYAAIGVTDFNGDGLSDIVLRNNATGDWGYLLNGDSYYGGAAWRPIGPSSPDYDAVAVADFNGDGVADVAFRNRASGDWGYMSLDASGLHEVWHGIGPSSIDYAVIGAGDFNGDGVADLAFRNTATGDWGYMAMNRTGAGFVWHGIGPSSTAYAAVGTGDFNGDGVADLAFRNTATGDWGYMALNNTGAGFAWHGIGPSSTDYAVIGAYDVNHDGVSDLVFEQQGGSNMIGYMALNRSGAGQTWTQVSFGNANATMLIGHFVVGLEYEDGTYPNYNVHVGVPSTDFLEYDSTYSIPGPGGATTITPFANWAMSEIGAVYENPFYGFNNTFT